MERMMSTLGSRNGFERQRVLHLTELQWMEMARSARVVANRDTLMNFSDRSSLRMFVEEGRFVLPRGVLVYSIPLSAPGFDGADMMEKCRTLLNEILSQNGSADLNASSLYEI
jgi:hypothetical protein